MLYGNPTIKVFSFLWGWKKRKKRETARERGLLEEDEEKERERESGKCTVWDVRERRFNEVNLSVGELNWCTRVVF